MQVSSTSITTTTHEARPQAAQEEAPGPEYMHFYSPCHILRQHRSGPDINGYHSVCPHLILTLQLKPSWIVLRRGRNNSRIAFDTLGRCSPAAFVMTPACAAPAFS